MTHCLVSEEPGKTLRVIPIERGGPNIVRVCSKTGVAKQVDIADSLDRVFLLNAG